MLSNACVLVTGGTGSLGKQLIATLLERFPTIGRVIVFSRDELKQYELAQQYPAREHPALRFVIGDVRDAAAVRRAMAGVDVVIHTAALKHVPIAEHNPLEAIKTNILGAQNVIDAALDAGVERVVALSTDKAAAPVNIYGATKLCSDKLFIAADHYKPRPVIKFAVVRYGNVFASRGSVVPLFVELRKTGVLPITDPRMTRFNITLEEGANFVLLALERMWGGELFVPKIPSFRIVDLAQAIGPDCEQTVVGMRPGEKLHEELITETDGLNTLEFDRYFTILPATVTWDVEDYRRRFHGRRCPPGFRYSSDDNTHWLDVALLHELCRQHLDVDPATTSDV